MVVGSPERARRIRMARAGAGLSQGELAAAIGEKTGVEISRNLVSRYEIADRDVEMSVLKAIAEITDTSLAWLTAEPALAAASNSDNPGYLNSLRSLIVNPFARKGFSPSYAF